MKEPDRIEISMNTVIACAAEGQRRSHVLAAAIAECRRRSARLILYDIDSASAWMIAMPDDEPGVYGDPLTSQQLRRLGRPLIADQVDAARQEGVEAFGWLPAELNAEAVVEYAAKHHASWVLLSKQLESPGFLQRMHHLTAERALSAAGTSIEVMLVDGDQDWTAEQDMDPSPVNALDAGLTKIVGGSRRAAFLLSAAGVVLLVAALMVAGAVIFLGIPLLAIVGAIAMGAVGSFFILSARQRRLSLK